jgi:hypothetical protein
MAFIDRLDRANPDKSISFHELTAGMRKVQVGDWTVAEFKTRFNLDASDDAQVDQLVAHFQALSAEDKKTFGFDVEANGVLWERERQTKAEFIAALGMT